MHIDERILINIILGRFLEVVQFLPEELIIFAVFVHDCSEEHQEYDHQHAPKGHQNLLTLGCIVRGIASHHFR